MSEYTDIRSWILDPGYSMLDMRRAVVRNIDLEDLDFEFPSVAFYSGCQKNVFGNTGQLFRRSDTKLQF